MAVVHHSNYIRYFEVARNRMMADWGLPLERFEKEYGIQIPIVSVECRFKHPARMGDVLTAVAEIDDLPLAKLKVRQSVINQDGNVCAEGSVVLGFIDAKTFRPVRCPDVLVQIIQQQLNNC
jgi:acyl-CoA thioester hydrolase